MGAEAQQDQAPYRHNTHVLPEMIKEQARKARKARRLDAPTMFVVLLVIPALVLHFSNVVLALLIGGVAATAQKMLLSPGSNEELQDVEEDVEEDVQSLLKNAQDLSATDRVILKELENIKRQLEKTNSEG